MKTKETLRTTAIAWWNNLSIITQIPLVQKHANRSNPDSLTGREIEEIWRQEMFIETLKDGLFINNSNITAVVQDLKVNQKDNTINIKPIKNSYSREEVIKLINSFEQLCYLYQANKDWFPAKKTRWIEENL